MPERTPSRRAPAREICEITRFSAGEAGLLGACSCYSDTLLEVMASRQKITDRHQIQQHDRKAERGQICDAPAAPPDPSRGKQLEGVHDPAHERDEDLRILQRHRL